MRMPFFCIQILEKSIKHTLSPCLSRRFRATAPQLCNERNDSQQSAERFVLACRAYAELSDGEHVLLEHQTVSRSLICMAATPWTDEITGYPGARRAAYDLHGKAAVSTLCSNGALSLRPLSARDRHIPATGVLMLVQWPEIRGPICRRQRSGGHDCVWRLFRNVRPP